MLYWCSSFSVGLLCDYHLLYSCLRKLLVLTYSYLFPSSEHKQTLPGNPQNTLVREVSRLTTDLHFFLCTSSLILSSTAKHLQQPHPDPNHPSPVDDTDLPLLTSNPHSLLYPTPQMQQALPGPQANLIRGASRLTSDLHLFFHSSKVNLPVSVANFLMWPLLMLCTSSQETKQIMVGKPDFLPPSRLSQSPLLEHLHF